jgi:hypothetical protein
MSSHRASGAYLKTFLSYKGNDISQVHARKSRDLSFKASVKMNSLFFLLCFALAVSAVPVAELAEPIGLARRKAPNCSLIDGVISVLEGASGVTPSCYSYLSIPTVTVVSTVLSTPPGVTITVLHD